MKHTVVGIGEVLFDCFPGSRVLGGAPVNVVVHAHQLLARRGGCGVVVSRVGTDDLGSEIIEELNARGVVTNMVQRDSQLPTGSVQIQVSDSGEPNYTIEKAVAWENINYEESLENLAGSCDAVCFGSLAQRGERSRSTIHQFLAAAGSAIRLFDVNLRQSYYDFGVLDASLKAATVVKLNQEELYEVHRLLNSSPSTPADTEEAIRQLQDAYALECIALTRGSKGTVLYHPAGRFESEPIVIERSPDADNVGAGDACSAGLVFGLLMKWEPEQTLQLANRMGAFVASRAGATPTLPDEITHLASIA